VNLPGFGLILSQRYRSIHHDPDLYDKPDEFIPERYLRNEMGFRTGVTDIDGIRKTYAFGAGRRICPGQHLAENSLVSNYILR
jgi:cytochrome P450 family 619